MCKTPPRHAERACCQSRHLPMQYSRSADRIRIRPSTKTGVATTNSPSKAVGAKQFEFLSQFEDEDLPVFTGDVNFPIGDDRRGAEGIAVFLGQAFPQDLACESVQARETAAIRAEVDLAVERRGSGNVGPQIGLR